MTCVCERFLSFFAVRASGKAVEDHGGGFRGWAPSYRSAGTGGGEAIGLFPAKQRGSVRTSGWVRSALPMWEVWVLPGDGGRKLENPAATPISDQI